MDFNLDDFNENESLDDYLDVHHDDIFEMLLNNEILERTNQTNHLNHSNHSNHSNQINFNNLNQYGNSPPGIMNAVLQHNHQQHQQHQYLKIENNISDSNHHLDSQKALNDESSISEDERKRSFGCRICRLNHDPLYYPCKCSGSIKYVHEDCLLKWLEAKHGRKDISETTCEVCGEKFKFKNVYAENAPQKLTLSQFFSGLLSLLTKTLVRILRPIFVLLTWALLVPTTTGFLWNFYFGVDRHKYDGAFSLMGGWGNLIPWIIDGAFGSIVCISIFTFCLLVAVFKEFLSNHPDLHPRMEEGQEQERDQNNEIQNRNRLQRHLNNEVNLFNIENPQIQNQNINLNQNLNRRNGEQEGAQPPEEVTLDAFLGFEGPITNMFESIAFTLIFIVATLNLVVFVPYTAGYHIDNFVFGLSTRQTKTRTSIKNSELSFFGHAIVLGKGYLIQVFGFLLWTILVSIYRMIFKSDTTNQNISRFLFYLRYVYMFLKVAIMIACNFFLTPVILGVVINLSTASFFNETIESRIESLLKLSFSSVVMHYFMGMVALLYFGSVVRSLRMIVRNGVLWFLTNPDDPEFNFFRNVVQNHPLVHLRRIAMTHVLFFILVLALIRTPLKFSKQLIPSIFPLTLPGSTMNNEFIVTLDRLLILIFTLLGIAPIWGFLTNYIKSWIEFISEPLGLWDYFFDPEINTNEEDDEVVINSIRIDEPSNIPFFFPKITIFLLITWCISILIVSLSFLTPLLIGKLILGLLAIKVNDFMTWTIGLSVLYHLKGGLSYVLSQLKALAFREAFNYVFSYFIVGVKVLILSFLWCVPLAGLMGNCFYVVFVFPFYPIDAHPQFPKKHLFSIGWMLGSIFFQVALLSNEGSFLHKYKEEINRVKEEGWRNINMTRILGKIFFPMLIGMELFLILPIFFARYIFPLIFYNLLGLPIEEIILKKQLILHYSHLIICCFYTSFVTAQKISTISKKIYQKVFDQQFVVQRRLENVNAFEES